MSAKAIREVDGKRILCEHLESYGSKFHAPFKAVQIVQGVLMYSSLSGFAASLLSVCVVCNFDLMKIRGF